MQHDAVTQWEKPVPGTPERRRNNARWRRGTGAGIAAALLFLTTVGCKPQPPAPRYPGDVNGKVCLGFSAPDFEARLAQAGGSVCVHRSFHQWGQWDEIRTTIAADQAANRLPWVSVKPPPLGSNAEAWTSITAGNHNAEITALNNMLVAATAGRPALFTFHHEPDKDAVDADGGKWAAAYSYIHDKLADGGALAHVADPPIVMEWLFNPTNGHNPSAWITKGVLQRMPFLGLDFYENNSGKGLAERIPPIRSWMEAQGFSKMVGIAEMGCTDKDYVSLTAVECLRDNYAWAKANTDKIGVISYFNSVANSKPNTYWPLDEGQPASTAKMDEFQRWLHDPTMLASYPG